MDPSAYTTTVAEKQAHPSWVGSVVIQLRPSLAVLQAFEDTVVGLLASWRWSGSSAAVVVAAVVDDVWHTILRRLVGQACWMKVALTDPLIVA